MPYERQSPYLMSLEMQDDVVKETTKPDTLSIFGATVTYPMLLLLIFLAAVALSKPVCEMYSKSFCVLPRFLPRR